MKALEQARDLLNHAAACLDDVADTDEPATIAELMAQAGANFQRAVVLLDDAYKAFGPALEGRARELAARG